MKLAIALCAVTTLAHADDKKYTMADLKALVTQQSYREAVQHLEDVSPSERTADWQEVAGNAAAGLVTSLDDADEKLVTMRGLETRFPLLLKSAKYRTARTDAGPPAFAACFHNPDRIEECRLAALKFVDADATNAKLTLGVAKTVRMGMMSYGAVPFFKRAVAASKTACKDDDLEIAVVAALGLPYDNALFVDAKPLAQTLCWSELKKPILKELAAKSGGYFKLNACDLMRGKSAKETGDLTTLCAPDAPTP